AEQAMVFARDGSARGSAANPADGSALRRGSSWQLLATNGCRKESGRHGDSGEGSIKFRFQHNRPFLHLAYTNRRASWKLVLQNPTQWPALKWGKTSTVVFHTCSADFPAAAGLYGRIAFCRA